VARRAYLRRSEPDVVAAAAWYSALFLHHLPDMAVLVVPLVYSNGRAAAAPPPPARVHHNLSAVAAIGALNVRVGSVQSLTERVLGGCYDPVTSRLIEFAILSHGTWLVVFGMATFALAVRIDRPALRRPGQGGVGGCDRPVGPRRPVVSSAGAGRSVPSRPAAAPSWYGWRKTRRESKERVGEFAGRCGGLPPQGPFGFS
jgi:hypothetical protein